MKKGLLSGVFALALIAATAVPTFAASWVRIGEGHYIDADSIRPSTNYGTYTMLTKYIASGSPLEIIDGKEIWTIKTNSFVDCTTNYAKTVSYTAYDSRDKVVTTGRNVWKQWYGIDRPGSRAYESYAFVCTDKYLDTHKGYGNLWWY